MKRGAPKPPKGKRQVMPDNSPETVAAKIAENRAPPIEQFDSSTDGLPRLGKRPKK